MIITIMMILMTMDIIRHKIINHTVIIKINKVIARITMMTMIIIVVTI